MRKSNSERIESTGHRRSGIDRETRGQTRKRRILGWICACVLSLQSIPSAFADQISDMVANLSGKHIHAEWTKHRKWIRNQTPLEDDSQRIVELMINNDGIFTGTYHEEVGSWSTTLALSGDAFKGTFRASAGFLFHIDGSVLVDKNTVSLVWPISKSAIDRFGFVLLRRRNQSECSISDAFMKQPGADVQFEFNRAVEHHNGSEPITSSKCTIS